MSSIIYKEENNDCPQEFHQTNASLTAKKALTDREKLRKEVAEFIDNELNEEDVINIIETAITMAGLFSVTIWHKKK